MGMADQKPITDGAAGFVLCVRVLSIPHVRITWPYGHYTPPHKQNGALLACRVGLSCYRCYWQLAVAVIFIFIFLSIAIAQCPLATPHASRLACHPQEPSTRRTSTPRLISKAKEGRLFALTAGLTLFQAAISQASLVEKPSCYYPPGPGKYPF